MTQEELDALVESHKKWLNNDQDGERLVLKNVNLSGISLCNADFRCADLRGAIFHNTNLGHTDLSQADLRGADLSYADLRGAVLRNAYLIHAVLPFANLSDACLDNADLRYVDLRGAILRDAVLDNADLRFANLYNVDLRGADLSNIQLDYSNLFNAKFDDTERYRTGTILKKSMIGWKKCKQDKIVKLRIPKGAVVFCVNGKKCRTNKAKVLSVNDSKEETAVSLLKDDFIYVPGENLEIDNFDLYNTVECATGIHFFKSKKEAKEH